MLKALINIERASAEAKKTLGSTHVERTTKRSQKSQSYKIFTQSQSAASQHLGHKRHISLHDNDKKRQKILKVRLKNLIEKIKNSATKISCCIG